jgi:DNA-binding beta-propeller fold protein YncE
VSHPRLAVYARQAEGQVAPLRVIEGHRTGLSRSTHGIAIDLVNNEIVVPSNVAGALLAFDRTVSGNAAPVRVLQGSQTRISSPQGVAIDHAHDEVVIADETRNSILVFARTASGNTSPLREIRGPNTGIVDPQGIVVDPAHDEIIVAIEGNHRASPPVEPALLVFRRTADGDVAPIRTIRGPATMLLRPRQLQLDPERDELVLADRGLTQEFVHDTPGFIAVWDRAAGGNVAPKRFLRGPKTLLTGPRAVYVDTVNSEIGAGDTTSHMLMVYPRDF